MRNIIEDYSYIVNSELKRNRRRLLGFFRYHSSVISFEDVRQDLYVCILSILGKKSYKNKSKLELQKIVRISVRNYISGICKRGGKSSVAMSDQSIYDVHDTRSFRANSSSMNYETPEQATDVSNLMDTIQKWGRDKDEETKLFLREVVNPSDALLDEWDQLLDNVGGVNQRTGKFDRRSRYNLYRNTGQIPCTVFGYVLGIAASKCRSILSSLAEYLKEEGYTFSVLQYQK